MLPHIYELGTYVIANDLEQSFISITRAMSFTAMTFRTSLKI